MLAVFPQNHLLPAERIGSGKFDEKAELYRSAIDEKRRVTTLLRGKNFDKLNKNKNGKVYTGIASFLSLNQVSVELEKETVVLQGECIFINTGSTVIIPEIEGIEDNPRVYTSESLMNLPKLPKRLAINWWRAYRIGICINLFQFWFRGYRI